MMMWAESKMVFVHICFDIYKLLWSKKAEITFRT